MKLLTLKNAALLCLTLALASCSDKDKDEAVTPDDMTVISATPWQIAAINYPNPVDLDGDGKVDDDLLKLVDACHRDDIFTFKKDSTYTITEGATKCGTEDVVETGRWYLNANGTKMIQETSQGNDTADVVELRVHSMKLREVIEVDNVTLQVTEVYKR